MDDNAGGIFSLGARKVCQNTTVVGARSKCTVELILSGSVNYETGSVELVWIMKPVQSIMKPVKVGQLTMKVYLWLPRFIITLSTGFPLSETSTVIL